jgi:hypothetical protein
VELQHLNVKLYLEDSRQVDLAALVPVFHQWIQEQSCEELLIDVADYRHVFAGPGVVLVGHQADYSLDNSNGRLGVRYNRKAVVEGTNQDRFRHALRAALVACQRLEADQALGGRIRFNRRDLELSVNDRLLACNTTETYDSLKPELQSFFQKLFGGNTHSMKHNPDPRRLFSVEVSVARPIDPDQLMANIST